MANIRHSKIEKLKVNPNKSDELSDLLKDIDMNSLVKSKSEFVDVVDSSIISVDDNDDTINYKPLGIQLYGYSVLQNKDDEDRYAIRKHGVKTKHLLVKDVLSVYAIDKFIVFQLDNMAMYFNTSTGKISRKKW